MNQNLKFALGLLAPYSLVKYRQQQVIEKKRIEYRRRFAARQEQQRETQEPYSYEAAISQLTAWGLDPDALVKGSLSPDCLEMCEQTLSQHLPHDRPLGSMQK